MDKTYNTKLTAEQKQDLKEYKQSAKNAGGVVVFIRDTTIAMFPDGYGKYYIGKAVASKREVKLRAKVGMFYALERAYDMNKVVSDKVYEQILNGAKLFETDTQWIYQSIPIENRFEVIRYL